MRTKKNISEIIYNINNYSRLEWFYYLMEEINSFASNRHDINIRKDYLNDIVKSQLKNLKLGYSILNELYKKFKKVLEGETYKEIFINDDEDLVIERKDNSMIFFRKKSYEKLTNLDKYFKLYNEDTAEKYIKRPKKTDLYNTILTRKQTSLLAYYLRKNKFILDNTSDVLLSDCFGKMTGFSKTQINKDYKGLTDIIDITDSKNDFEVLIYSLKKLITDIESDKQENEKIKNLK